MIFHCLTNKIIFRETEKEENDYKNINQTLYIGQKIVIETQKAEVLLESTHKNMIYLDD